MAELLVHYQLSLVLTHTPVATENGRRSVQWVAGASVMGRRRPQICSNTNLVGAISTFPPVNMDRIVLLEYFVFAHDNPANLLAKLNSAQLRRHAGVQCLGQIMILQSMFTNAASVPGMTATCKKQVSECSDCQSSTKWWRFYFFPKFWRNVLM